VHKPASVVQAHGPVRPATVGDKSDDFTVITSEATISSETVSWHDPYLLPSSLAILIIASVWAHRRFR
jgi:hypothetical protein